ncbi:unnamed protein product [Urochloa humidicola]
MATPLGSVGSTHCFARMDDYYMDALNAALVGISGEDLLDEAQGVGRADSSMSGSASSPPVPRKVLGTEQKRLQMDAEKKEKEEDERMFIYVPCLFCLCVMFITELHESSLKCHLNTARDCFEIVLDAISERHLCFRSSLLGQVFTSLLGQVFFRVALELPSPSLIHVIL